MPSARHCSRIDSFELKFQMEKRLGLQKAEKYFNLVTGFLTLKLGKSEFNKLCVSLIGRENIRLHNELIKAIVKNAVVSKTPPPKKVKGDDPLTLKIPNGVHPRNGLQSLCRDVFPQSPKKGRTPNLRERKFRDRSLHEKTQDLAITKVQEQELLSLGSKPPLEVNPAEYGEEAEQDLISHDIYSRSAITAPLGINAHSKRTRNVLFSGSNTCHYNGCLPPTKSLENQLKQKLKTEGLDISTDCVNLLNNGLDSFLKRIIKPSLTLSGSRSLKMPGRSYLTSMIDLRVATETNPKVLGEDWPVHLEKVCLFEFEKSTGFDNGSEFMST